MVSGEIAEVRYGVDVNTLEKKPATQIGMNEVGHVVLSLNQPLAFDAYRKNSGTGAFIVIDRVSNATVGAGMILEPQDRGATGDHWSHEPVAGKLKQKVSRVGLAEREQKLGQRGATVLIYGLTGSGKATVAYALEKALFDAGRTVTVLYGPDMRQGLCRDLGFTADDRSENLRRSAEVAKLFNDAGVLAVCAFVAPHDAVRAKAKQMVGDGRFLSVYLKCDPAVAEARDRTGAWAAARAGRIASFPGVSAAYEEPAAPDVVVETDKGTPEDAVEQILAAMRKAGFVQ